MEMLDLNNFGQTIALSKNNAINEIYKLDK